MEFLTSYYGLLCENGSYLLGFILLLLIVGYLGSPFWLWSLLIVAGLYGMGAPMVAIYVVVALCLLFILAPIRRILISAPLMNIMKGFMPKISATERTALEAGVVWAESELFSGKPDFKKLVNEPMPELTQEEKDFLEGPTEELCSMIDDWEVWRTRKLSDEILNFMKQKKFLGMIIPKEYGGLGFSAAAHGEVISKLTTRSLTATITVMVPNSLGPAELLNHYGTKAQKDKYLPRLADGREVPCFGLTEPTAGSDAGSIVSEGILFKGDDGKLKIKLNWNKRWITLAAISTLIGLAFRLKDPEGLLGDAEDLGITCALIPSTTPGVVIGRRHDPMGIPFYNCPTQGHDVVVDAEDSIIGGIKGAGQGWQMLMESLGAGRGISLPSQSAGGIKYAARVASNHAVVRRQFGLSIGKFEGVEEPLARIAGAAYFIEAMRQYTFGALNRGIAPPVVTAMCKYYSTEELRKACNDAMDILGGAGISMGPRNLMAVGYMSLPVGITVEGANILTRTLMIFGQGALRAHPYAFKEVDAIEKKDLKSFDSNLWGHVGHIARNLFRSVVLSATRGYVSSSPVGGAPRRYYQKLAWASASFAVMADISMGLLGGKLKVKEKLTGRFADILSWMYIGMATLRRFEAEGRRKEDLPFLHYSMKHCFIKIQESFDGIFANFDTPVVGWVFRWPIRLWSRLNKINAYISDDLTHEICRIIQTGSEQRDRITSGVYLPDDPTQAMGRMEKAFKLVQESEAIAKKIKKAVRKKELPKQPMSKLIELALEKSIITAEEKAKIAEAEEIRYDAIQVDDFSEAEFVSRT